MKHDMKKIREAFQRMHDCAVNNGPSYMRIPAEPTNDADLILSAAIDELEALRAEVAKLKVDCARAELRARDLTEAIHAFLSKESMEALTRSRSVFSAAPDSDERLREMIEAVLWRVDSMNLPMGKLARSEKFKKAIDGALGMKP